MAKQAIWKHEQLQSKLEHFEPQDTKTEEYATKHDDPNRTPQDTSAPAAEDNVDTCKFEVIKSSS